MPHLQSMSFILVAWIVVILLVMNIAEGLHWSSKVSQHFVSCFDVITLLKMRDQIF